MREEPELHELAAELHVSIGLFIWRLRQVEVDGDLSFPQMSALARLERMGPTSPGALVPSTSARRASARRSARWRSFSAAEIKRLRAAAPLIERLADAISAG